MKLKTNKISILGTLWTIKVDNSMNDPKLINNYAYTENYGKMIVYEPLTKHAESYNNLDEFQKKALRHEIIHAFFHESGLKDYDKNEVLVDYLATQFYKLDEIFKKLGIEEKR